MKQVIELKRKTYEELQQTVIELITEKCLLEKEIKHLKDRKDYYKHEYYSVCDLLEKMEKALDKACKRLESFDTTSEKHWDKERWKEWCLEDVD